jgi:hypothetical protein
MPLLDHRIAELGVRLPISLRIKRTPPQAAAPAPPCATGAAGANGSAQDGLRRAAGCLRGRLRARMEAYVDGAALSLGLNPTPARQLWRKFLTGRAHWADQLWNLFALGCGLTSGSRSRRERLTAGPVSASGERRPPRC